MRKYASGLVAVILALSTTAFTYKPVPKDNSQVTYWWYRVDYSSGSPLIPAGTPPLFTSKQTHAYAQANDGCADYYQIDCLWGFQFQPLLPSHYPNDRTPRENNL